MTAAAANDDNPPAPSRTARPPETKALSMPDHHQMPDHHRTAERVHAVIDDLFGLPAEALGPDVTLQDGLQLDSLSVVELQVAIEDAFDVRFDDADTADVTTVGDLIAAVDSVLDRRRKAS